MSPVSLDKMYSLSIGFQLVFLTHDLFKSSLVSMIKPCDFWNKFYLENKYSNTHYVNFLRDKPNQFLKDSVARLKTGKALDIGFGSGADSIFLALQGFDVVGLDFSDYARLTAEKKISSPDLKIEFKTVDVELHLFGMLNYDTIILNYYRPPNARLYQEIIKSLKYGGTLIIESLLVDEINEVLGKEDDHRNFYFKHNELLKNLTGLRILFYSEGLVNGLQTIQCIAQKPSDKDIEKYNLFNMADSTKENKKSAQHELAESLFKKK